MTPRQIAEKIIRVLDSKMARDPVLLEVTELTEIADYFIICTAGSTTQIKAMSEEIERLLKEGGIVPHHVEGYAAGGWVLLDYADVIVHLFLSDVREFYSLERLWNDAKNVDISELISQR